MFYDLSGRPQEDNPAIIWGCAGKITDLRTTEFSCIAAEVAPGVLQLQRICDRHAPFFRAVERKSSSRPNKYP